MRTYEEDWDTPEFKKSNRIAFRFRKQDYSTPRPSIEDIPKFDDALAEGFKAFYELLLTKADAKRFWDSVTVQGNPAKPETLLQLTKDLYADIQGVTGPDGEEDPKESKSSGSD